MSTGQQPVLPVNPNPPTVEEVLAELERLRAVERNLTGVNHSLSETNQQLQLVNATQQTRITRKSALVTAFQSRIEKYNGSPNARTIEAFLEAFEVYIEAAEYTETESIKLFGLYLGNEAKEWWNYFSKVTLPTAPIPTGTCKWTATKAAFKKEFLPQHHVATLRAQWHALTLRNGLADFVGKFRKLSMQIPDLDEKDIFQTLIAKLDAPTLAHLRAMQITTADAALSELVPYAALFAPNRQPYHYRATSQNYKSPQSDSPNPRQQPTPMELDNTQTVEVSALRDNHAPYKPTAPNAYQDFQAHPRLTDEIRNYLRANNGCFYCREINTKHGSRDCPKKTRPRDF